MSGAFFFCVDLVIVLSERHNYYINFDHNLPEEKIKAVQSLAVERSLLVEHTGLELIYVCLTKDKKCVFCGLSKLFLNYCPSEVDSF